MTLEDFVNIASEISCIEDHEKKRNAFVELLNNLCFHYDLEDYAEGQEDILQSKSCCCVGDLVKYPQKCEYDYNKWMLVPSGLCREKDCEMAYIRNFIDNIISAIKHENEVLRILNPQTPTQAAPYKRQPSVLQEILCKEIMQYAQSETIEQPAPQPQGTTDEQQAEGFPKELNNAEFNIILHNAIQRGLVRQDGTKYVWCEGKALLAYFAKETCKKMRWKSHNNGISWQPFEKLFNVQKLNKSKKKLPKKHEKIDNLLLGKNDFD